jgi:dolichol-phosphate mannosyltransferase
MTSTVGMETGQPALGEQPGTDGIQYSVVIPVFNEQENVEHVFQRVSTVMDGIGEPYEILFVDDGSSDRTPQILRDLCARNERVRALRFTRNFGQEAAVQAGYTYARGDWIIQMDGDLQNPPEEVHKLLAKRDEGFDIVYGARTDRRDPLVRRAASQLMRWVMRRMLRIELPRDISTFRLMRSSMAKLLAQLPERQKFLSALACWVGARYVTVDVKHAARAAGRTKYDLGKLVNHTFDLVVGFSSRPLRLIGIIGLAIGAIGLCAALWAVLQKLLWGTVMGWSSIFAAVMAMGGMQLVALSLIGEYVARIFTQSQARPIFMVAERIGPSPAPLHRSADNAPRERGAEHAVS